MTAIGLTQAEPLSRSTVDSDLSVSIGGFKAIRDLTTVRIAPLTIIAGVNSSGKSSFMQPLLLMKQTLEAPFDPGPLLLYGPNAKFTEAGQIFSKGRAKADAIDHIEVEIQSGQQRRTITYTSSTEGIQIARDHIESPQFNINMRLENSPHQQKVLREEFSKRAEQLTKIFGDKKNSSWKLQVQRDRCLLGTEISITPKRTSRSRNAIPFAFPAINNDEWFSIIRRIVHVPGLRGNPEREYPRSATGTTFPGTFETYVASIVHEWAVTNDDRLAQLSKHLESLGLTWKISAKKVNDASVALFVGRTPHAQRGGARDLVSVADVGFGVSQTLPVLVALLVAKPGQIVYLEQPEIHLHPRAQLAMTDCLVSAANRGVKVVVETHSSLLLRGIQTSVARGQINPESVSMNWFTRDPKHGNTSVDSAQLDDGGRFGEWPVDFDDVAETADWDYLSAVESPNE